VKFAPLITKLLRKLRVELPPLKVPPLKFPLPRQLILADPQLKVPAIIFRLAIVIVPVFVQVAPLLFITNGGKEQPPIEQLIVAVPFAEMIVEPPSNVETVLIGPLVSIARAVSTPSFSDRVPLTIGISVVIVAVTIDEAVVTSRL